MLVGRYYFTLLNLYPLTSSIGSIGSIGPSICSSHQNLTKHHHVMLLGTHFVSKDDFTYTNIIPQFLRPHLEVT